MRTAIPMLLACALLGAGQPLRVASVERQGLPPYEDGQRFYRIEGDGCENLGVGETLTLTRNGEKRRLGKLKVNSVKSGYALAVLAAPGETYPLRGDLIVRHEKLLLMPELPVMTSVDLAGDLEPREPKVPEDLKKRDAERAQRFVSAKREAIFFLRGDSNLSPGALRKLQEWVGAWGKDGQWFLASPALPGQTPELLQARISTLKTELQRLGVGLLETHPLPAETPGRYDAVYVGKER